MSQAKGTVIAIDGPDGVGKTTQIELLGKYLQNKGQKIHYTRASGGTPIGEELRKASLSHHSRPPETDLYIALAMHTALGYDLQKRKKAGETILVDRSPLTIVAYQAYGSHLPNPQEGFDACEKMLALWDIDTLFMLQAPQSVLDKRRQKRIKPTDYFENQPTSYHHRVQEGYREALAATNRLGLPTHIVSIDGTPPTLDIHKAIVSGLAGAGARA